MTESIISFDGTKTTITTNGVVTFEASSTGNQNNIQMNGYKVLGSGSATLSSDLVTLNQLQNYPLNSLTVTGDLSMASSKITNLATPTLSNDATTKQYVDNASKQFIQLYSTALPAINNKITSYTVQTSNLGDKIAYSSGNVTVQAGNYLISVHGSFDNVSTTATHLQVQICQDTQVSLSSIVSQQFMTQLGQKTANANNLISQTPTFIYTASVTQIISLFLTVNNTTTNPQVSWFVQQI